MKRFGPCLLVMGIAALPFAALAQPARDGNIYNGMDHQPTAGAVRSREQAAGVAPSQPNVAAENRELSNIDKQLRARANRDAKAVPNATNNVYGVEPGGVVVTTPNGGGNGAVGGGTAGR